MKKENYGMRYFISDLHFNHNNIIKLCNREFKNYTEMNASIIKRWNQKITPNDEVFIIGDLSFGDGEMANTVLRKLNGEKILIIGNHDRFLRDYKFDKSLLKGFGNYMEIKEDNKNIVMFHYPIIEWNGFYRDSIHLYGHIHNKNIEYMDNIKNAYNVGWDVLKEPMTLDEIINRKYGVDIDN